MIEIRCPKHPVRMLLRVAGRIVLVDNANMIEVACRDCRREAKQDDPSVKQVVHLFNIGGVLVETKVVR